LTVPEEAAGERIDRFLGGSATAFSRTRVQRWLEEGLVLVAGRRVKASHRLLGGETVEMAVPEPKPTELAPHPLPLDVLFEDGDIVVVNKPPGLVVHPGAGSEEVTLVHALLAHCADLRGVGDCLRPGIVHRLDRDTSGVIVVAKHDRAHHALVEQFSQRQVRKEYLALVWGTPAPPSGTIAGPIGRHPVHRQKMAVVTRGGREAFTHYEVRAAGTDISELLCRPTTGRTHQIRVHLAHIGHPVWGDPVYGTGHRASHRLPIKPSRQMLHALRLELRHPATGELLAFTAPVPQDVADARQALGL